MFNILCAFLWVIFQALPACSSNELFQDTRTPKASVGLAHSDSLYDNVGMLHVDSILPARATVTYIGGRTCLTAAHNFQGSIVRDPSFFWNFFLDFMYHCNAWFKPKLRVVFEVNGEIKHYTVLSYSIHPDWVAKKSCSDIAIVQLDREVGGLARLPLSYDFGGKVQNFKSMYKDITVENRGRHIPYQLTYVGYGGDRTGSLNESEIMHNLRTACRSFLISVTKSPGVYVLCSAGHGINLDFQNKKNHTWERRPLLPFEMGMSPGMSGGPTFYDGKVIGINSSSVIQYVDPVYQKEMDFRWYANFCIQLVNFFIPPLWWYPISTYPVDKVLFGTVNLSLPLGPHKQWIEDTKREFDKGI